MHKALPTASAVLLVACGSATALPSADTGDGGARAGDSGAADGSTLIATGSPCSVEGATGKIPGVSISIRSRKCRYAVGEPAEFTYEIVTDASVPPIKVAASQSCGSCGTFSDDALSFTSYSIGGTSGDGKSQSYCVCDTGCCAPDQAATYEITPARRSAVIQWSGRNWYGPSDTNNAEGAFFPPGSYAVHVTFEGGAQAGVEAVLPIEIVP